MKAVFVVSFFVLALAGHVDVAFGDVLSEGASVFDYFSAAEDPRATDWLLNVDFYHTTRVLKEVRNNDLTRALAEVDYTLRHFPNHPRGLLLAEMVANIKKSPMMAVNYYEKAIAMYPHYALTHAQFGRYLVTIGKVDQGIERLQLAIEMDPKLPTAYAWLAEGYYQKGDKSSARQAEQKARSLGFKGELSTGEKTGTGSN